MSAKTLRVIDRPSPNHNARAGAVRCIVLHADGSPSAKGTLSWIAQRHSGVSYHFLIDRDGTMYRCVPDHRRAWHAGKGAWKDSRDPNSVALGVSFANDQRSEPFTLPALEAGVQLCATLCIAHQIPPDAVHITTHKAVALPPGRKRNPGPLFPLDSFIAKVAALVREWRAEVAA